MSDCSPLLPRGSDGSNHAAWTPQVFRVKVNVDLPAQAPVSGAGTMQGLPHATSFLGRLSMMHGTRRSILWCL